MRARCSAQLCCRSSDTHKCSRPEISSPPVRSSRTPTPRPLPPRRPRPARAMERRVGRPGKATLQRAIKCRQPPTERWEQRAEPARATQESQVGWRDAVVFDRLHKLAESGVRVQDPPKSQAPGLRTSRRMGLMFTSRRRTSKVRLQCWRESPLSPLMRWSLGHRQARTLPPDRMWAYRTGDRKVPGAALRDV